MQSSVKYVPAGDDIMAIDQPGSPAVPIQPLIYTEQQKGTKSALSCPGEASAKNFFLSQDTAKPLQDFSKKKNQ